MDRADAEVIRREAAEMQAIRDQRLVLQAEGGRAACVGTIGKSTERAPCRDCAHRGSTDRRHPTNSAQASATLTQGVSVTKSVPLRHDASTDRRQSWRVGDAPPYAFFTHQPDPRRFLDVLQDPAAREARDVLGFAGESEDLYDDAPLPQEDA